MSQGRTGGQHLGLLKVLFCVTFMQTPYIGHVSFREVKARVAATIQASYTILRQLLSLFEPPQSDCAPSEDSDQPGHPPSLIRVFAVRMKKAWVLSYPLSAQRRLRSVWAYAIWVFAGRTLILLVLSSHGSFTGVFDLFFFYLQPVLSNILNANGLGHSLKKKNRYTES